MKSYCQKGLASTFNPPAEPLYGMLLVGEEGRCCEMHGHTLYDELPTCYLDTTH